MTDNEIQAKYLKSIHRIYTGAHKLIQMDIVTTETPQFKAWLSQARTILKQVEPEDSELTASINNVRYSSLGSIATRPMSPQEIAAKNTPRCKQGLEQVCQIISGHLQLISDLGTPEFFVQKMTQAQTQSQNTTQTNSQHQNYQPHTIIAPNFYNSPQITVDANFYNNLKLEHDSEKVEALQKMVEELRGSKSESKLQQLIDFIRDNFPISTLIKILPELVKIFYGGA